MKVRDLMIPLSEYTTATGKETLQELFNMLDNSIPEGLSRPHRDVLVVDESGDLRGKLSILDVFMALEPSYAKMDTTANGQILTGDYVRKIFNEYDLWSSSLKEACSYGAERKVEDVMHTPAKEEFIQADETLDLALHAFIMGVHQPLIVMDGKEVVGVLRLGDVFDTLRESIQACKL
ncbi:hypothetical protein JCM12178A_06150 [Salidesulfovibrio brasiliensis]